MPLIYNMIDKQNEKAIKKINLTTIVCDDVFYTVFFCSKQQHDKKKTVDRL